MNIRINGLEIDPSLDGETHINAYSGSACSLGRMLSNFTLMESDTPDGKFASLEGYFHWLKLSTSLAKCPVKHRDLLLSLDNLRVAYGLGAQQYGRRLRADLIHHGVRIYDTPSEDFTLRFKQALYSKITTHQELLNEMLDNRLPIVHYYVMGTRVIYKPRFDWLSNLITEIQLELLEIQHA